MGRSGIAQDLHRCPEDLELTIVAPYCGPIASEAISPDPGFSAGRLTLQHLKLTFVQLEDASLQVHLRRVCYRPRHHVHDHISTFIASASYLLRNRRGAWITHGEAKKSKRANRTSSQVMPIRFRTLREGQRMVGIT